MTAARHDGENSCRPPSAVAGASNDCSRSMQCATTTLHAQRHLRGFDAMSWRHDITIFRQKVKRCGERRRRCTPWQTGEKCLRVNARPRRGNQAHVPAARAIIVVSPIIKSYHRRLSPPPRKNVKRFICAITMKISSLHDDDCRFTNRDRHAAEIACCWHRLTGRSISLASASYHYRHLIALPSIIASIGVKVIKQRCICDTGYRGKINQKINVEKYGIGRAASVVATTDY